jgi:hypothetical protein
MLIPLMAAYLVRRFLVHGRMRHSGREVAR